MNSVYLVRHGQAGSRRRYDQLSPLGRRQARLSWAECRARVLSATSPLAPQPDGGAVAVFTSATPIALRIGRALGVNGELMNAFNRHQFGAPNTNVKSPLFGHISGVSGARNVQIGLRLDS